jgi:hypothetical protein
VLVHFRESGEDMPPQTIKIIIAGVLLLQGLSHGRAFVALLAAAAGRDASETIPVRSWLLPGLSLRAAAGIASVFWFLSTVGFVAASLSFWGTFAPGGLWRQLAVISAIISTVGIALFSGIWPGAPNRKLSTADTIIALVINIAVLVALLWVQWPPHVMFDN